MKHWLTAILQSASFLMKEEQNSTKERIGEYLYYEQTSPQHPHSHFLRESLDGSLKQTVLDVNRLTEQADGSVEIGQVGFFKYIA